MAMAPYRAKRMTAPLKARQALRGIHRLSPRRALLRLPPRLSRDRYLWYTVTLAPIALVTAAADGQLDDATVVLMLSPLFIGLQALLGLVPSARRPLTDLGWSFLRLLVAFTFVALLVMVVGGDTAEILRRALEVLSERFGYRYGSIYLWDGEQLVLGAQQNYTSAPLSIQPGVGVVGGVARSHELAWVTDVAADANYVAIH